jgi:glycosyltransferase involved in cell wall biosynthesis
VRWEHELESDMLRSFDIGIMPLKDDPWERGKCGFKLIQYMSVGLPVIGSRVGANEDIIKHGENGFLVESPDDWVRYLGMLISDQALRKSMGSASLKLSYLCYSPQRSANELHNIFSKLKHA